MDTSDEQSVIGGMLSRRYLPGIVVALVFFVSGVLSLREFGVTYDELITYRAALLNVDLLTGSLPAGVSPYSRHELPGYHFVIDAARGFFAKAMTALGVMDLPASFHFFHLVLSALAVFLVYRLALAVSGRARTAFFSALTLALFPKFIAHSQNNPKDLTGLFFFVLSLSLVTTWLFRGRVWRSVAAGAVLGIAFTTHVITLFVPVIAGTWLLLTRRDELRLNWRRIVIAASVALVVFVLSWPWLWAAPLQRLLIAYRILSTFSVKMSVLFFGQLVPWGDTPWYYFLGSFAVSTPVLYLLLALPALFLLFTRAPDRQRLRETAVLGLIWCSVLVLADMRAASHYDGIRHFLAFLPGYALLVGVGCDSVLIQAETHSAAARGSRLARNGAIAVLGAAYLVTAVQIARIHPYEDAYLNEVTNALLPGPAEDSFEIEYWGSSAREAAAWLNRNAEPDAQFYYVWSDNANFHLTRPAAVFDPALFFSDTSRPRYLMLMTRRSFYDADLRRVEKEYQPVYFITRQKGTLMSLYKNTVKRGGES